MVHFDFEENRYILDVPTECPNCGEELQLDNGYDQTFLRCENPECVRYELNVTEEFKELERLQAEETEED